MARYGVRQKVWVTPYVGSPIKYGFSSGVSGKVKAELGQNIITPSSDVTNLFYGLNSPKPARASGIGVESLDGDRTGSASSYVDAGSISQARALGYNVGRGIQRTVSKTAAAESKCVSISGNIVYAWMMPKSTISRLGSNLAVLGIRDIAATDHPIYGAGNAYKPQRVKYTDAQGSVSTFIDPNISESQLPDGFSLFGRRSAEKNHE